MLIEIMKAWREKLAHEQMAQISRTQELCAEQKESQGTGGALVARMRKSRGQNVVGLQSSGEDETDVEVLM